MDNQNFAQSLRKKLEEARENYVSEKADDDDTILTRSDAKSYSFFMMRSVSSLN